MILTTIATRSFYINGNLETVILESVLKDTKTGQYNTEDGELWGRLLKLETLQGIS